MNMCLGRRANTEMRQHANRCLSCTGYNSSGLLHRAGCYTCLHCISRTKPRACQTIVQERNERKTTSLSHRVYEDNTLWDMHCNVLTLCCAEIVLPGTVYIRCWLDHWRTYPGHKIDTMLHGSDLETGQVHMGSILLMQ